MSALIQRLRHTTADKRVAVLRIVGGLPLLVFGAMHLVDPEPFRQILEASGLPFVELNLIAAPLTEVVAGLLLITGYYARMGGLLGATTMLTAAYSTLVLSQLGSGPEVPAMALPLAVLAISTLVLWRGAGAWSLDLHSDHAAPRASADRGPAVQEA